MSHDGVIQPRDQLQAQVVERLRAADGAPVGFSELRAMGIENPALLGYELAAVGLPIEQVHEWGSRALVLDPLAERQPVSTERNGETPELTHAEEGRVPRVLVGRVRLLSAHSRWARRPGRAGVAASAAMVVVLAVVLVITLGAQPARQPRLSADHPRDGLSHARSASAGQRAAPAPSVDASPDARPMPAASAGRPRSVAVSPAAAAALEAAGHQLLAEGRYAQAIGELRQAVRASGGSVARCEEPTSEACLTFAYALYDLGSALRLDGDPHAAIAVLSERLQIDNQRTAVEQQLDLARAGVV